MEALHRFGGKIARIATLARDQRGLAAIEFSLAIPIVLMLIMAAIEFGNVMFANAILEGAVREASRRGSTGYAPCDMTRAEYIEALITQEMFTFANEERSSIKQTIYNSFSDIKGEPFTDANGNGSWDDGESFSDINGNAIYDSDLGSAGLGDAGAIVVYDIEYELDSTYSWFTNKIGFGDGWNISARATVRNEPAAMDGTFGAVVEDCDLEDV